MKKQEMVDLLEHAANLLPAKSESLPFIYEVRDAIKNSIPRTVPEPAPDIETFLKKNPRWVRVVQEPKVL